MVYKRVQDFHLESHMVYKRYTYALLNMHVRTHSLPHTHLIYLPTQVCLQWEEQRRAGEDTTAHPPSHQKQIVSDKNQILVGSNSPAGF